MGDFGFKASRDGQTVFTDVLNDLIITSSRNVFKAVKWGQVTINVSSNLGTTTVAHGLNFTPTFLAFFCIDSKVFAIGQDSSNSSDSDYLGMDGYSDGTNLNLTVRVSTFSSRHNASFSVTVYYYIFGDTARQTGTQTAFPSPAKNFGMKVSKDGKSAFSTYVEDFVFHTRMTSLKIKAQGSYNITSGGYHAIAHGLAFIPAFLVFVSEDNLDFNLAHFNPNVSGDSAYGWTDATNLNLASFNFPGQTHYFKYVIFANRAKQ